MLGNFLMSQLRVTLPCPGMPALLVTSTLPPGKTTGRRSWRLCPSTQRRRKRGQEPRACNFGNQSRGGEDHGGIALASRVVLTLH
jgi:hypothetical protein